MADWKERLIPWAPPALLRRYFRLRRKSGFFGSYRSWSEARAASRGYDSASILEKVSASLLLVKEGKAVYERDSVLFDKVQHAWPLLTGLLWVASRHGNRLNLLDLGGSLGSSYYQCRSFLRHLDALQWSVVEQEGFVRRGRELFADDVLRFYYTMQECLQDRQPETFLLSSVLPYLEHPQRVLEEMLSYRPAYVIVDRTLFIEGSQDRLTVQIVPQEIYGGSYPAWILAEKPFLDLMLRDYDLVADFDSIPGEIDLGDRIGRARGFIFSRRRPRGIGVSRGGHGEGGGC
jgi:putative methyltransferase (TIGR04325 family)